MGKLTYIQWIYIKNQQLVKIGNSAEFRGIPYSVFHIYFVFFRKIPQKIRNGNDGIPVNSVRNFSKILMEFHFRTELNLDFQYNTTTDVY